MRRPRHARRQDELRLLQCARTRFFFPFFSQNFVFPQKISIEIAENGAFTLVWGGGGTEEATGPAVIASTGL
jgi:hypothetical protein